MAEKSKNPYIKKCYACGIGIASIAFGYTHRKRLVRGSPLKLLKKNEIKEG